MKSSTWSLLYKAFEYYSATAHTKVSFGSWLCENVVARRADRTDLPSDRYSRREGSPGLPISINQRTLFSSFLSFRGFSHSLGHSRPSHPAALAGYVRSSPKPNMVQASAADAICHERA